MGVVERVGDGRNDLDDIRFGHSRRELFALQPRGVGAFDVVHRDPQLAFVFAAVVNANDVFVVQTASEVGLPVEALAELQVGGQFVGQDLERVATGQPWVLCQVHLAHAADPQTADDRVSSEDCARG